MVKVKNKVLLALSVLLCAVLFSGIFVFIDNTTSLNADTETQSQSIVSNHTDDVAKLDEETVVTADEETINFPSNWTSQIETLLGGDYQFTERVSSIIFSKTTLDGYEKLGELDTGLPVYYKTTVIEATDTTAEEKYYDIVFVYSGTIKAPEDCSHLFAANAGLSKLNTLKFEDNFDVSDVTTVANMFSTGAAGANVYLKIIGFEKLNFTEKLKSTEEMFFLRGRSYAYSIDLSNFNTSGVTTMRRMFSASGNWLSTEDFVLDISHLDTRSVEDMSQMFSNCNVKTLNFGPNFITSNVTNMSSMFNGAQITSLVFPSTFDTNNVTDMSNMFDSCTKLDHIDISSFNTQNVKTMSCMFQKCTNLKSVNLSGIDTTNVTNMMNMFMQCENLKSIALDINTTNATSMMHMFSLCNNLTNITFGDNFEMSNTSCLMMFYGCTSLTNIDLSNWKNVTLTGTMGMFGGCTNLKSINLSSLDFSNDTFAGGEFNECSNLTRVVLPKNMGTNTIALPTSWSTELTEKGATKYCITTDETKTAVTSIGSSLLENYAGGTLELYSDSGESLATPQTPVEPATGVNASLIAVLCSAVAVVMIVVTYVIISNKRNVKRKINAINIDSNKKK